MRKSRYVRQTFFMGVLIALFMLAVVSGAGAMGGMKDTTPPTISNILPTGTVTGSSATVSASYADTGMMASGIKSSSATLTVSGATISGCTATTSQISCTASDMAPGSHTITVSVSDNAGNVKTATGTFTMASSGPDVIPPAITNVLPTGTVGSASTTVSASYSDSESGINSATATLNVYGATVSGCTATATQISCTASGLTDGSYTVNVSVADNAGNTGNASGSFNVAITTGPDVTPPAISNIQPTGTVASASSTVSASFSDTESGIDAATATLSVSGATVSGCTTTATQISCTTTGMADGTHTVDVSVADNAGNTGSAIGSFNVSIPTGPDVTAPVITNVQPSGTIYTTSTTISADYSDPAPSSGIDPSSAMIHLDGRMLFTGCVATETHVSCPKSGLSVGNHSAQIYITDNAGHTGTVTGTFTVSAADTTAPVVTNVLPTGTVTGDMTTVSASYSDAGSGINVATAALTVSGAGVSGCTADATHVSCSAAGLAVGSHQITVTVADNAGNTGTGSGSFTVAAGGGSDVTAPAITAIQPTGTITSASIPVSAYYSDTESGVKATTAALTVSGATVSGCSADATHISCTATGMAAGPHTINVTVADNAGNTGTGTSVFEVADSTAPVISNIQPAGSVGSGSFTISASYSDPAPSSGIDSSSAMIHVDGRMLFDGCVSTEAQASCPVSGLAPGLHEIEIYINDNAGNLALATVTITVAGDTCTAGKPNLSLAAPSAFWASYADYVARKLSINWRVHNSGSATAHAVSLNSSTATNGSVATLTAMPVVIGDIAPSGNGSAVIQYHVPVGIGSFRIINAGSASDCAGIGYAYP